MVVDSVAWKYMCGVFRERLPYWLRRWVNPWVGKIPWRKVWQPTPVFLPGESHGQRRQSTGPIELDTTERLTLSLSLCLEKQREASYISRGLKIILWKWGDVHEDNIIGVFYMYLHALVALWMEWRREGYKERLLDGYWNDLSQGAGHWLREIHLKDILEEDQEDLIPDLVGEIRSGERNKSQLQDFSLCPFCWNMLGPPTKIEKAEELVKVKVTQLCLFATPWTIQSMEFSRPEYWSS